MSIGEVLTLLKDEFPDVTISKIRFLESQGLLDPERTPSGYRKFYEPDIERLRWILQQQRENFLPLRVIKDRLDVQGGEANGESAVAVAPAPAVVPASRRGVGTTDLADAEPLTVARDEPEREVYEPPPRPVYEPPAPAEERPTARSARPFDPGVSAASLTGEELMAATGLSEKALAELERFGLVAGRAMGRDTIYDEEALTIGRLCAAFARFGVEPRHLRMYKVAAEREASFFEQVVLPLLKQRNPNARRQAVENLGELAALGDSLRAAMLRGALKGYTTLH
jgi:DNA-binding transcriptional MerR regulator